ncbi:hypothetical protein E9099_16950 [Psychroserpens sp. NJDZ02]|nr:hypothetical protein E9099_16950 [Psychroserpens sp. NJDZ02]
MEFFKNIKAFQNNSELADNIEILKTYNPDATNNFCKYFIKKSIAKEVHLMYLDLTYFRYLKLQWQLKYFLIQSRDFKMSILKYLAIALLGFIGGFIFQKNKVEDKVPNNSDRIELTKSTDSIIADKKTDTLK